MSWRFLKVIDGTYRWFCGVCGRIQTTGAQDVKPPQCVCSAAPRPRHRSKR